MCFFLPLINKGLNYVDKTGLKIIILSLYGILFIWKDLKSKEGDNFCKDTPVKTLLSYYILGAYIGKFVLNQNKDSKRIKNIVIKNIIYCLILIYIFIKSSNITYDSTFYERNNKYKLILKKLFYNTSNSMEMALQSLSLILFFYINKI